MKLAMAMTACNRPQYLEFVLVTLANNAGHKNYKMHFSLEPVNPEVIEVAKGVNWMPAEVHVNNTVFGVRKNPYEMLDRVFKAGFDGVLYLEEDVKLSTDAVALADWYFNSGVADDYLCLNLYNHDSVAGGDPKAVIEGKKFSALGMGLTRNQWYNHFKPAWYAHPSGWDFSITDLVNKGGRVLQPELSRSHHIGRTGGTYYRPHLHDKEYIHNHFYEGPPLKENDFFVKK